MKYQVWCAASEAWSFCGVRLHPILPQASTQNSTRLTGKLWHARGTMTLLPLSGPPLLASDTSAVQMWRGKRRGNHTDINRKSSWVQKEIVFQGQEQPKSLQSRWQFQMSHIEICSSAGFRSFTGTHLGRNAWTGLWAQLLLIRSDDCTHFLQDSWSLSSYQEPSQRDEIPPPNSAKSCIFEGTTAIDRQPIKAESQGTAAQRSNPTCGWLHAMGENDTWWQ